MNYCQQLISVYFNPSINPYIGFKGFSIFRVKGRVKFVTMLGTSNNDCSRAWSIHQKVMDPMIRYLVIHA